MKNKALIISLLVGIITISIGCGLKSENTSGSVSENNTTSVSEEKAELVSVDISNYGIPLTIMIPEGAEVSKSLLGSMEIDGVTNFSVDVEKGKFLMNISMLDVDIEGETMEDMMEWQIESLSEEAGFEIIQQDETGLIYKTEDEEIGLDYSFYHLIIKNDREISITTGVSLMENFTLEEVKEIYAAAQQAK